MGCGASASQKYAGPDKIEVRPRTPDDGGPPMLHGAGGSWPSGQPHVRNRILRSKGYIGELFELTQKPVSEGAFSKVRLAKNKRTGDMRAVKCIAKARKHTRHQYSDHTTTPEDFEREVKILSMLDHPNIVRAFETYEDPINHYLVMELCEGGELLEALITLEDFSERRASHVLIQVLQGLSYMHGFGICHRDIKPRNVLLKGRAPVKEAVLKIVDFGSAALANGSGQVSGVVGSIYYRAPEIREDKKYRINVDCWSCGVLMYSMLLGYPTMRKSISTKSRPSLQGHLISTFEFGEADWKDRTPEAQKMLKAMLARDPKGRCSAANALQHPWILRSGGPGPMADRPLELSCLQSLQAYSHYNAFKKKALRVIAQRLDDNQIAKLKETFMMADRNGDGVVTAQELKSAIIRLEPHKVPQNLKELMQELDEQGHSCFDYTEFIAATLQKRHYTEEHTCWMAFRALDLDGGGTICKKELKHILQEDAGPAELRRCQDPAEISDIVDKCDKDGDGQIDFEEFMDMMRSTTTRFQSHA